MSRAAELRATFEGWKLGDGRVVKSQFKILLRLQAGRGYSYRYHMLLEPTMQKLHDETGHGSFAESKLDECKAAVAKQFERQITEWA